MLKSDIDVKWLMLDPWDDKTVSKLESHDEFKSDFIYSVWDENEKMFTQMGVLDKVKVCAYIILAYDLNTQLRKEVPIFNQRKIVAAELAGFEKESNGKFIKMYEDILVGANIQTNNAISKFIRLFASPKYISLVYYWSILSAEYSNVATGLESKDYKSTIANIEKLETKIKECTDILYGGSETADIRKALYESVEKDNLRLRPENISNMTDEELEDNLGNPYIEGYKVDPLKFKSHK